MKVQWKHNPITGNWTAELPSGRTFTVEVRHLSCKLWYGKEGRRILVGVVPSPEEAKEIGQELANDLLRVRHWGVME